MSTLFIGCLYSETDKDLFLHKSKRGYQYASQNLQEAIIDGLLCNNELLSVITIPALSSFPFGNKLLKIKESAFIYHSEEYGRSLGFLNIRFLNSVSERIVDKAISQWISQSIAPRRIIVYGMHPHLMSIAAKIKSIDPHTITCLIIPDLPEYMGFNKVLAMFGFQKRKIEKAYSQLDIFDSFAVLTKSMLDRLPIQRPSVIVEGIYRGDFLDRSDTPKERERVIMYSGGLHARYGVVDLVKSFSLISDSFYKLWICGDGDAVPYIKEQSELDKRIQYLGSLPLDRVRVLQRRATLLVNPRHSNEVFTKYSFPSKTLEYLASGTPVLMSHLSCIPKEYDDYLFYFKDESIEGMRDAMIETCSLSGDFLKERGLKSQSFIRNNKTPKFQTKKILDLLSSL